MKNFILALLLVILTAANATAQVTSTFNQDYGLANHVSNTWHVDTSSYEWLAAALRVELNAGSIYQNAAGDDSPPPTSAVGGLQYDSYMTGGFDTDYVTPTAGAVLFVIENAYEIDESIYTPGPAVFESNPQLIDATWISMEDADQVGNLMLSRITLSDDAQGTFKFRIVLDANNEVFYLV